MYLLDFFNLVTTKLLSALETGRRAEAPGEESERESTLAQPMHEEQGEGDIIALARGPLDVAAELCLHQRGEAVVRVLRSRWCVQIPIDRFLIRLRV